MQVRKCQVQKAQAGKTIQDFLGALLGLSRNKAKALLDSRQVHLNGHRIWMARHTLRTGDVLEIPCRQQAPSLPAQAGVLYDGADYVVANKPAGCLSNGPESLEADLRRTMGLGTLLAVHRLDRDTSGCLLLAKRQDAFDRAVEVFRQHRILKVYHAIAAGRVPGPEQIVKKPLEGEPAVTHIRVLDSSPLASHLSVKIETGRTHQIRRHLESIGHPVLGDKTYGLRHLLPEALRHVERQMLHAVSLQFESPFDGEKIRVTVPPPSDFSACLKRLRLK